MGAIIGAAIAGNKGAAIGFMAGAAGGAGVVQAGGRNDAVFAAGTPLTLKLRSPSPYWWKEIRIDSSNSSDDGYDHMLGDDRSEERTVAGQLFFPSKRS